MHFKSPPLIFLRFIWVLDLVAVFAEKAAVWCSWIAIDWANSSLYWSSVISLIIAKSFLVIKILEYFRDVYSWYCGYILRRNVIFWSFNVGLELISLNLIINIVNFWQYWGILAYCKWWKFWYLIIRWLYLLTLLDLYNTNISYWSTADLMLSNLGHISSETACISKLIITTSFSSYFNCLSSIEGFLEFWDLILNPRKLINQLLILFKYPKPFLFAMILCIL